jgi:1-aminocyclopropane-1-carboxylate deaminase
LPDFLFLDFGSGLTFISALQYFVNKNTKIVAILTGPKYEKVKEEIKVLAKKLEVDEEILNKNNYEIIKSLISPGYAKTSNTLENFIYGEFRNGLPLEPVYSAKSMYTIKKLFSENNYKGTSLYLHQGGLLNFASRYLAG